MKTIKKSEIIFLHNKLQIKPSFTAFKTAIYTVIICSDVRYVPSSYVEAPTFKGIAWRVLVVVVSWKCCQVSHHCLISATQWTDHSVHWAYSNGQTLLENVVQVVQILDPWVKFEFYLLCNSDTTKKKYISKMWSTPPPALFILYPPLEVNKMFSLKLTRSHDNMRQSECLSAHLAAFLFWHVGGWWCLKSLNNHWSE